MTNIYFGLAIPACPAELDWMPAFSAGVIKLGSHIDSLWMTDHFFWDDAPTLEAWTAVSYYAALMPHLKLGTIVLGQSYRNPALLAKMASTLHWMSSGRLILGVGAGWKEDEYRAYNYPYPSAGVRIEQLEDTLEIIKRLWTQPGKVSYQGRHYAIRDAYCEPKPSPMPRILVGGGGEKTMLLAARYADEWNMPDAPLARFTERMAILHRHCESIGRDPQSIVKSWFGRLAVANTEADALALGGGKWTRQNAFVGTPAQVVEQLGAFVAAGVTGFQFEILGFPKDETIGLVTEQVLPKL